MIIRGQKISGWQDFVELLFSIWLFASPFVLGFWSNTSASLTAMLVASVVMLMSMLGISTQRIGDEWGNIGAAVVLIASPWLFGYAAIMSALLNAVVCGGVLIVFAVLAILEERAEKRAMEQAKPAH